MDRKVATCTECGQTKKIAAESKCYACYRRHHRHAKATAKNGSGMDRDGKKLIIKYSVMLTALAEIGLNAAEIFSVKKIVDPHLTSIARFLFVPGRETAEASAQESARHRK